MKVVAVAVNKKIGTRHSLHCLPMHLEKTKQVIHKIRAIGGAGIFGVLVEFCQY